MVKKLFLVAGLLIIAVVVYYASFFWRNTEVDEAPPAVLGGAAAGGETPSRIARGEFRDVDRIHRGAGIAVLARTETSAVLRFEGFRVTNGPDLRVYLTRNPNPSSDLESLGSFIDLGALKGNLGNQNYVLGQDAAGYDTVVIWCRKFSQLFSYANLR